jgi:hypothetical protein
VGERLGPGRLDAGIPEPPHQLRPGAGDADSRQPQHLVIEPVDENSCRVELSSDTPQALAAWLGMLGVDFDIENPERHPEIIEHLRQIGERYRRAAGVPGGIQPPKLAWLAGLQMTSGQSAR